jgi:hypothetical protein
MFVSFLKVLIALWPFIKEWAFGGKSVAEAYGENRRHTVLTILLLAVSAVGAWSTFRLVKLGIESKEPKPSCVEVVPTPKSTNAPGATVNESMSDIAAYLNCQENPKECDTP